LDNEYVFPLDEFVRDLKTGNLQMSEKNVSLLATYYLSARSRQSRSKSDQFVNVNLLLEDFYRLDSIASNIIHTYGSQIGTIREAII
jgi:hypothetical protein